MEESELARAVCVRSYHLFSDAPLITLSFFSHHPLVRYPGRPRLSLQRSHPRQSPFVTPRHTKPSRRHSSTHSMIPVRQNMLGSRRRRRGEQGGKFDLPRLAKRDGSRRASSPIPSTSFSNPQILLIFLTLTRIRSERVMPSYCMPLLHDKSVGSSSRRPTRSCAGSPRCTRHTRNQRIRWYLRSARLHPPSRLGSMKTRRRAYCGA